MNILTKNVVSAKAPNGTVIGTFAHAGASGGQWVLDVQAQVFFSVDTKNNLIWSPATGINLTPGFYPICVSAIFNGYDAEDSQFIVQVTS
jgi:hypothetical protein